MNCNLEHIAKKGSIGQMIRLALLFVLAVFILGCGPKIKSYEPPIGTLQDFSISGNTALHERWWTVFNDGQLNTLIDSALSSNLDLAAAWQQFQASTAIARREGANLWPQIDASAQSAFNRPQNDFRGGENIQIGLAADYELDLWGRVRSAAQAERLRAEASFFDYQTAAITLSSQIAFTWYSLVAANEQVALAKAQLKTNEDIVKLIRARFGSGQIRAVDILRQTQLLEATRNQLLQFETNAAILEHQLAVLLGSQPQNAVLPPEGSLPELSPIPETGLPLELIRRRPDIQASYQQLQAADMDWASAVRSKYPRIAASYRGQLRANNFNSLFENWAYSIAGNILAPLFYGGQLSAEVDRTEAIKRQRLFNYGQTVLLAFQEVEDALITEEKQTEQLKILDKRLALAQKTNRQLRNEFLNGISPYLDVLLALDQEQQLRRNGITARLQVLQTRIALYRALAGSFESEPLQNP